LHVVQLTDFYRPVVGGLERHVETLSRELVQLGHTVTVVTLQTGDHPAEETLDGVRIVRIRGWSAAATSLYADTARPFHPTFPDPGVMAALRKVIRRERPAVVHSHSWIQYSYFPLHRPWRGPAHVVTLHDYGIACAKKTLQYSERSGAASTGSRLESTVTLNRPCAGPRLKKCLGCVPEQYGDLKGAAITIGLRGSRALHRRADCYIAVSSAVAEGARQVLPEHPAVVVVPTMVPNDLPVLAQTTPRPAFLPPEDGYLMFVGALGPHKGVDVLLEARRRMRNQVPLVLIGTPRPDTPPTGGPGIVTAHNVPSAQVMASWMRASIAVVPSVWNEPLGQVALEAMLAGRPVVASDVGGLRDVVHHEITGLRVPPGDPGALAEALDRLLGDPQLQHRLGTAGMLNARQFEAAAVAPRVVQIFEEVLSRRINIRKSGR
jgi:glycosyltransferase involved in cell wall biosynthesis